MPSLETPLTRRLDIDAPIVQAPIGSATCPALAAAVSESGGLGTLAVTWDDPDDVPSAVAAARRRTDGPVGANVVVDPDATATPAAALVDACLDAGVDVLSLSFGDAARTSTGLTTRGSRCGRRSAARPLRGKLPPLASTPS